ncbi:MAG TPA: hypothetical protein VGQ82_09145, partial [Chthoniobacterales bacterium]|nr:hypothetical protein [Chthoniobacterales bacterium]
MDGVHLNPKSIFAELKRRNVYRVAVAYGIVGWAITQIATQICPFFNIPNWCVRLVVILLLFGFPFALVLAWIFELTPEGLKRTDEVARHESITRRTGRKLDFLIIGVLLLVIGFLTHQRYGVVQKTPAPPAQVREKSIAVLPFENRSDDKQN